MRRFFSSFSLAAASALMFGGCAADYLSILDHPDAVSPGGEAQAALVNSIVLFDTSPELQEDINRDSLFVALGAPAGWTVQQFGYYVATHLALDDFPDVQDTSVEFDSSVLRDMRDSIAAFAARQQPLTAHDDLAGYLAQNTIPSSDIDSGNGLDGATVDQWLGYGASINLTFDAGTRFDTVFEIPDTVSDQLDPTGLMGLDSAGMSVLPVFLFAVLSAPAEERSLDTLYYYSKTGAFPDFAEGSSDPMMGDVAIDVGSLAFQHIAVTTSSVARAGRANAAAPFFSTHQRADGAVAITIAGSAEPAAVRILSPAGATLRTLTISGSTGVWNGETSTGGSAPAGTYLLRITRGEQTATKTIQFLR
jgi:hypothetical protein